MEESNNNLEPNNNLEVYDPEKHGDDGTRLINKDTHLWHMNLNLLAAVDIITTGHDPRKHDVVEVAILALNSQYNPHKGILPFNVLIKPRRPEHIDIEKLPKRLSQAKLFEYTKKGLDAYLVADRLEDWVKRIHLISGKKIVPLCHNWVYKRPFLMDWLGFEHFNSYFGDDYRDPVPASLFANDRADLQTERIPYPKQTWAFLCSELGVAGERKADTLQHCIALAEVYKKMLRRYI